MNRFLRYPVRRLGDHVSLGLFVTAYVAILAITFAPAGTFGAGDGMAPASVVALP